MVSAVVRYRVAFHAEHAFAGGLPERVPEILRSVESPIPTVQITRWEPWPDRLATTLGPEHPDTLDSRQGLAASYRQQNRHWPLLWLTSPCHGRLLFERFRSRFVSGRWCWCPMECPCRSLGV